MKLRIEALKARRMRILQKEEKNYSDETKNRSTESFRLFLYV